MEQRILCAIPWHIQAQQVQGKGRCCFISLASFHDRVTLGEGKAVDVVCLDFSKTFDTVFFSMLLEKLDGWRGPREWRGMS